MANIAIVTPIAYGTPYDKTLWRLNLVTYAVWLSADESFANSKGLSDTK